MTIMNRLCGLEHTAHLCEMAKAVYMAWRAKYDEALPTWDQLHADDRTRLVTRACELVDQLHWHPRRPCRLVVFRIPEV